MLSSFVFALLTGVGAATVPVPAPAHGSESASSSITSSCNFTHVGYCPSWNLPALDPIDFGPFSHINIAFAIPRDDSSLFLENEYALPDLVARIHANGGKALIAIGGITGSAAFPGIAGDPRRSSALVGTLVDWMSMYQLDGVDLDWEYPGPGDFNNMLALMAMLRGAFEFHWGFGGKVVSVAVPVMPYDGFTPAQAGAMATMVDYINLMQYDINGPWGGSTGPNAPIDTEPGKGIQISISGSIKAWRALGWPAAQMVAGLPFYGRAQHARRDMNEDSGAGGQYAELSGETVSGDRDDLQCGGGASSCPGASGIWKWKWLRKDILQTDVHRPIAPWVRHWDAVAQTPWLFNSETMTFITYEDPDSIARKAWYARSQGLRGVMVWSMDMESDSELTRAVRSVC